MVHCSNTSFTDSKPHYEILDGLRGVAALMVVWYHIFEGFATSPFDQKFNHGYLAVDFFFILSGFVVSYAYDDRWGKMSIKDFFKRRLIRLQPMVVLGVLLGAITFCIQGCVQWNGTKVSFSALLLAILLGVFLIPAVPGTRAEIRGNGEMFPLNGPSWSLFFEYIGNILYALLIRKLSTKALAVLVASAAIALFGFAIFNFSGFGHLGVGWTLAENNFIGGLLRLTFAFSAGLFISRIFKPIKIKGAFWICSIIIIALLSMPYIGGEQAKWLNGIFDSFCVICIFPILVFIGASGTTTTKISTKVCKFLGDISYPLYMIHYPFMYLFYAWLWKDGLKFEQVWPVTFLMFFGSILIAYICLKIYDEPIRKWLSKKSAK